MSHEQASREVSKRTLVILLRDGDDAGGLARLLSDVTLDERLDDLVYYSPPVRGMRGLKWCQSPKGIKWRRRLQWRRRLPSHQDVHYLIAHEPGLPAYLRATELKAYVGTPHVATALLYRDIKNIIAFPARSVLDFAAVVMIDNSALNPNAPFPIFDSDEAERMLLLATSFPRTDDRGTSSDVEATPRAPVKTTPRAPVKIGMRLIARLTRASAAIQSRQANRRPRPTFVTLGLVARDYVAARIRQPLGSLKILALIIAPAAACFALLRVSSSLPTAPFVVGDVPSKAWAVTATFFGLGVTLSTLVVTTNADPNLPRGTAFGQFRRRGLNWVVPLNVGLLVALDLLSVLNTTPPAAASLLAAACALIGIGSIALLVALAYRLAHSSATSIGQLLQDELKSVFRSGRVLGGWQYAPVAKSASALGYPVAQVGAAEVWTKHLLAATLIDYSPRGLETLRQRLEAEGLLLDCSGLWLGKRFSSRDLVATVWPDSPNRRSSRTITSAELDLINKSLRKSLRWSHADRDDVLQKAMWDLRSGLIRNAVEGHMYEYNALLEAFVDLYAQAIATDHPPLMWTLGQLMLSTGAIVTTELSDSAVARWLTVPTQVSEQLRERGLPPSRAGRGMSCMTIWLQAAGVCVRNKERSSVLMPLIRVAVDSHLRTLPSVDSNSPTQANRIEEERALFLLTVLEIERLTGSSLDSSRVDRHIEQLSNVHRLDDLAYAAYLVIYPSGRSDEFEPRYGLESDESRGLFANYRAWRRFQDSYAYWVRGRWSTAYVQAVAGVPASSPVLSRYLPSPPFTFTPLIDSTVHVVEILSSDQSKAEDVWEVSFLVALPPIANALAKSLPDYKARLTAQAIAGRS